MVHTVRGAVIVCFCVLTICGVAQAKSHSNSTLAAKGASCEVPGGFKGTCIDTAECKESSRAGYCAGAANIQCCVDYGACNTGEKDGHCITDSKCEGDLTRLRCPGPNEIQCCTEKDSPDTPEKPDALTTKHQEYKEQLQNWMKPHIKKPKKLLPSDMANPGPGGGVYPTAPDKKTISEKANAVPASDMDAMPAVFGTTTEDWACCRLCGDDFTNLKEDKPFFLKYLDDNPDAMCCPTCGWPTQTAYEGSREGDDDIGILKYYVDPENPTQMPYWGSETGEQGQDIIGYNPDDLSNSRNYKMSGARQYEVELEAGLLGKVLGSETSADDINIVGSDAPVNTGYEITPGSGAGSASAAALLERHSSQHKVNHRHKSTASTSAESGSAGSSGSSGSGSDIDEPQSDIWKDVRGKDMSINGNLNLAYSSDRVIDPAKVRAEEGPEARPDEDRDPTRDDPEDLEAIKYMKAEVEQHVQDLVQKGMPENRARHLAKKMVHAKYRSDPLPNQLDSIPHVINNEDPEMKSQRRETMRRQSTAHPDLAPCCNTCGSPAELRMPDGGVGCCVPCDLL